MRGVNHLRTFAIAVFIFLSLLTIGYTMNTETLNASPARLIKDGMSVIEGTYVDVVSMFKRVFTNTVDLFYTYEENKQLKAEMYNYEALEVYTQQLEEQVASLEDVLEAGKSLTDYDIMTATTVIRNVDQWHDFIVINKGEADGIEQDMAILSRTGYLIGKVISVNQVSSTVKLIKNQDFGSKVSAIISNQENSIGTVEGYDYKTDELVMTYVSKDVLIEIGDKVITSGLGGIYPQGLLIGEVKRVEMSNDGLTQNVYLTGEEHYNNMDYVIVVKREAVSNRDD